MTTLVALPRKTVDQETRDSVLSALDDILKMAERGEVDVVCIIARHLDGTWTNRTSDTDDFAETIGRLEILKNTWIRQHLDTQD